MGSSHAMDEPLISTAAGSMRMEAGSSNSVFDWGLCSIACRHVNRERQLILFRPCTLHVHRLDWLVSALLGQHIAEVALVQVIGVM